MKKLLTILVVLLFTAAIQAESPEKMSYQAVVRNTKGALVVNQNVGIKISIQKWVLALPKPFYSSIYAETQTPATNENGLISFAIGTGTPVEGSVLFKDIDWAKEALYLKTEIDPAGGTAYSIIATTQLLSVPYAQHSKTAEKAMKSDTTTVAIKLKSLALGDSYQGGIIFWLDETGQHGLIAANNDLASALAWNNATPKRTGAGGSGLYAGEMNTAIIVANQIADYQITFAAQACLNYEVIFSNILYGDWYLPSHYELILLYQNRSYVNNVTTDGYWSSTEADTENATVVYIGSVGQKTKSTKLKVRPIRKF